MTMPMMPGLTGGAANDDESKEMIGDGSEDSGLAAILEELDEETIASLASDAEQAYLDGSLDEYMNAGPAESEETAEDEAAESKETQSGEEAAGSEQHDPVTTATEVAAVVEEIAAIENQLNQLLEAAADSEGDESPIEDSLTIVTEALAEAEVAKEEADKAADDQDVEKAAEALATVQGSLEKAKTALDEAKNSAKTQIEENTEEPSSLQLWAEANA